MLPYLRNLLAVNTKIDIEEDLETDYKQFCQI